MSKQILDNIQLIRDKVLKFESNDDFYMISIMRRKKDHPEDPANENARMLCNYYIKNLEYFDSKIPFIKEYCEHFGARAYIKPQVRSCKAINRQLLKFMVDQIDNTDLAYATLTREIISGYHASRSKKFVLDLDNVDIGLVNDIIMCLTKIFTEELRRNDTNDIFMVPTFNGYHIITPGFNPQLLNDRYKIPKDTIKSDADTILYAVKETQEPK